MERDDRALDGLLRELARAPEGDDDAFVSRVLARTRKPASHRASIVAAAGLFLAMGVFVSLVPAAPAGRVVAARPACVGPDAERMRLLMKDPATGRLLLLGEVPIDAAARVPAEASILLQAVAADGMAVWTSPRWMTARRDRRSSATASFDRKDARSVEFARDVKPILDQHCGGCHGDVELARSAVKPFDARRSPLVTQTHAPLSGAERQQLALWVDLGAMGRP